MNRDFSDVLTDGPWKHEFVSANGARFHVALAEPAQKPAPLVILLHAFPQFWWAWRNQIPALVDAGYRVAAMDMRGTGASDKPPTGYDMATRTRDVAGVIRSLGEQNAVIIGHGLGGATAWAMASLQPSVTRAVAALSAPHPAHVHTSTRTTLTRAAYAQISLFRVPTLAEKTLVKPEALAKMMNSWAHVKFSQQDIDVYANALGIPFAAHNSLEPMRWYKHSLPTPLGRRFLQSVRTPVTIPALQLQGANDHQLRRESASVDASAFCMNLRYEVINDAGFFLPEEAPQAVNSIITDWLKDSVESLAD
ncbi:alpha/beta hydrolase [Timonella senegalensis]|uniref:alpha/beta fold hydrolase n=1 Tax=Timonella senegalensis TaxID=1465825 RepID=UPI002FDEF165